MSRSRRQGSSRPRAALLVGAAGVIAVLALAGCGEKKKARVDDQVAARVDGRELTVPQINLVLQQQRNLRPEQADAASRQVLERLIDQTLAVQKAERQELDRDPRVQLQIEAARREVIARAWAEKVGEGAPRPTAEEISAYYRSKPALFAERRIYSIQELSIEARPDQVQALRERLGTSKSINEFVEHLRADEFRFAANQAVRAAEQLPPPVLESLARLTDGQATLHALPQGVVVTVLAGSRSQPVSEEQARPVIEQTLLNERKRQRVESELKALRADARIDYVGRFAEGARPDAPATLDAAGTAASSASASPGLN